MRFESSKKLVVESYFSICIILSIILINPLTQDESICQTFIENLKDSHHEKNFKKNVTENNSEEYWGLIIAISDYNGNSSDLDIPEKNLRSIYDNLIQKKNWKKDNIKFLINENATANNILEGLNWLSDNVDDNDIAFLAYNGHGTEIPDENGDEDDGFDEAIVPWELNKTLCISDDTLQNKLDTINARGIAILLDCCLSGEFIEEGIKQGKKEKDNFQQGLKEDITKENRVILTSACGDGLALGIGGWGTPCSMFFSDGIQKAIDFSNDSISSAEELFLFTAFCNSAFYTLSPALITLTYYIFNLIMFLPLTVIIITFSVILWIASEYNWTVTTMLLKDYFSILKNSSALIVIYGLIMPFAIIFLLEYKTHSETNHWILPLAQYYDGYEGELPLILN